MLLIGPQQSRMTVAILQRVMKGSVNLKFLGRLGIVAQQGLDLRLELVHHHNCCCSLRLRVHAVHSRVSKDKRELQVHGLVVQKSHLEEMPLCPAGTLLPQCINQGGLDRNEIGSPLPSWHVLLNPVQRLMEGFSLPALQLLQGGAAIAMEAVEPLLHPTGN